MCRGLLPLVLLLLLLLMEACLLQAPQCDMAWAQYDTAGSWPLLSRPQAGAAQSQPHSCCATMADMQQQPTLTRHNLGEGERAGGWGVGKGLLLHAHQNVHKRMMNITPDRRQEPHRLDQWP
jgi:hypothetical protein